MKHVGISPLSLQKLFLCNIYMNSNFDEGLRIPTDMGEFLLGRFIMDDKHFIPDVASSFWKKIETEFWEKVDIRGESDCWEWRGVKFSAGKKATAVRGYFSHFGRTWRAHRLAFTLTKKPIPSRKFVCHKCGNSLCVNPKHLYAGTVKDNARDRINQGRQYKKIPDVVVREIRSLARKGKPRKELAEQFSISRYYLGEIIRKKARRYLGRRLTKM